MGLTDKSRAQTPSVPARTVVFSMVLLWATYFTLVTLRSFIADFDLLFEMGWRRLVVSVAGVLLTLVLWALLRLFDGRALLVKITAALLLALPVALAIGQINQLVFASIQELQEQSYAQRNNLSLRRDQAGNLLVDVPVAGDRGADLAARGETRSESVVIVPAQTAADRWRGVIDIALGRYFLLLAWASLYFALLAGFQARAAERREQEFKSAARAAELRSLRYQVNPHFLFNTLNSLSALVMTGKPERAERMIQSISQFYRRSLAEDLTMDVPLRDEFALQREYLDIEAVRFPDRLACVFDLPEELEEARVPGMILQPIVENSVKYGVSAVSRKVTITVKARESLDRLILTVSDDGAGARDGIEHGFGIGLANVRDRLEARFGPDIALTSQPLPAPKTGFMTQITIPLTRHG